MNSHSAAEAWAVFQKEWRGESRARHGLFTSALFGLLATVAMGFASFGIRPSPNLAAGMLCVVQLFAAVSALPRAFVSEDEQGTFDLLRLVARPHAIFWGKMLFNLAQMLISGLALALLFALLTGISVPRPDLYALAIGLQAVALAASVSLCGALVMGASNRWVLAGVLALPLLIPQVAMGVGALRVALGAGSLGGGTQNLIGLAGFGLAALASGPMLAAGLWRNSRPPSA